MDASGSILRYAWSVFWKTAVAGILLGVVVNMALSFFLPALLLGFGMSQEAMFLIVTYVAYAVSAVAYFVALKFVLESNLGKNIGGVRLDHVSRMPMEEDNHAH